MRFIIFIAAPLFVIMLFLGTMFMVAPAAGDPPKSDPTQMEPGALCSIHYQMASGDVIKNCNYLGRNSDWLVVSDHDARHFIPLKNVLRIDVPQK